MSSNPMINSHVAENVVLEGRPMTISNTINKTIILTGIVALVAYYAWSVCASGFTDKANMLLIIGLIAGLVLAIITTRNPKHSPITAPIYALCEGLVVGIISFQYAAFLDGIVQKAILITISTMFAMLFLYKSQLVRATEKFKKVLITAMTGIMVFYLVSLICGLFGHFPIRLFDSSPLAIGITLFICIIAALNFIVDFDFIEQSEKRMLPSYFEWYGGFTLLVTLIWLYIEVLRLLAQLNSRD